MIWWFILASIGLSLWRTLHRKPHAPAAGLSPRERKLTGLRDRYVAEELTLEDFEGQVADALDPKPREYSERIEVHVWDAPAGSALHIHLP